MTGNQNQEKTQDLFSVSRENTDKFFNGIRQTVPQYHQAITNLQQEYLQTFERVLSTTLNAQQEFAKKLGFASTIPDATLKIINDSTEELVRLQSVKTKIALAFIDAAQNNIKSFNDNAKQFSDFYQSWVSTITPKIN
jgi:predicted translin family RNA/ssDNA-binding protein